MNIVSKLPNVGITIFSVMSALANKHQAVNLSQGFPNFDCPEVLKERVNFHMRNQKNQYAPMPGVPILREKLAEKIEYLYSNKIDSNSEITITAGATQALFTAINTFVKAGDEVITIEPAYDCYIPAVELVGGVSVPYELGAPDFRIDWEQLGQLITSKTKMIVINTPHNPIGKVLQKSDMMALQQLTKGTDILILSDEVYEHLIFDGREHQSILRYPELFKRSLVTFSFGKTFHNTGWKMGYCIAPENLMKEFRKVHQYNVFSVNSFVQYGIADFLDNREFYLNLPQFYQNKRDYFSDAISGSRLKPLTSEGTYFQLFDYSDISDEPDTEFAIRMTIEYGVAAIPASVFYSSKKDEQIIRLCFAKTEDVLEKAGKLLSQI